MMRGYTTIEQSKKLAEILPIESADMRYSPLGDTHPWFIEGDLIEADAVPCWSLVALLDVLPRIHGLKPMFDLEECSIQYSGIDIYIIASNPIDVCYDTILKLHEQNLI